MTGEKSDVESAHFNIWSLNQKEKIQKIEEISKREMLGFSDERIKEVRVMGGCTCVEVYDPKTLEGFQQYAYERGVFSRPFLS